MKKKIMWIFGIGFVLLIASLWMIEKYDENKLRKVQGEVYVTKYLDAQVEKTINIFLSYGTSEIPENVYELGMSSLDTADNMYTSTMGLLGLIGNTREWDVTKGIGSIREIFQEGDLQEKDVKAIESYKQQIEEVVELTNNNLERIEEKIDNYWWK